MTDKPSVDSKEQKRLEALREYDILDSSYEKEFDDITRLAAEICGVPYSKINFIDKDRQWSKATIGLPAEPREVPRNVSVCQYTIHEPKVLEIPDLSQDERFKNLSYVKEDPKLRYYLGAPLVTDEGFKLGALCVLDKKPQKLSGKKKQQLQVLANEVIARLELRRKNIHLQELNSDKVKLMKMLSHDMKSPLNGIMGMASLMREMSDNLNGDDNEMLGIIEESAVQLNQMIDEVLSYSLIETKGFTLNAQLTNAEEVVSGINKLYAPAAKTKQIDLKFYTENVDEPVKIDKDKFEQITGNLISNALKFTKSGGKVSVSLIKKERSGDDDLLELKVADNGLGMDQAEVERLFDDSDDKVLKKGTSGERSTGIGLTTVKYFTDLHNGKIDVESEKGEGTTFTLTLPV